MVAFAQDRMIGLQNLLTCNKIIRQQSRYAVNSTLLNYYEIETGSDETGTSRYGSF